jgi:hypothetical protein
MCALGSDEYFRDLSTQCHRNAQIARTKYLWVQRAMAAMGLSVPFWFWVVLAG